MLERHDRVRICLQRVPGGPSERPVVHRLALHRISRPREFRRAVAETSVPALHREMVQSIVLAVTAVRDTVLLPVRRDVAVGRAPRVADVRIRLHLLRRRILRQHPLQGVVNQGVEEGNGAQVVVVVE